MIVLRSRLGMILVALAMVASAALAGALIGEVTGANAVVSSGEKPVMIDMKPTRALDTRGAPYGPIGVATAAPIGAKRVLNLKLGGKYGIPADATAVQLNVTTLNATASTFLTLYGTGTSRPNASTMNPDVGMTQFNGAVIPLGAGGSLSIYNHLGSVNVLIDVTGYFVNHNHDDRYYTKAQSNANYLEAAQGVRLVAAANVSSAGTLRSSVGTVASTEVVGTGDTRINFSEKFQSSSSDYSHVFQVSTNNVTGGACTWRYDGSSLTAIRVLCWTSAGAAASKSFNLTLHRLDGPGAMSDELPSDGIDHNDGS